MFRSGYKAQRLSSSLTDAIKQLEQQKKNKSEIGEKMKREIAELLKSKRNTQALIRVEQIIREDNLMEAIEIIQMFCDVLHRNTGLIQSMTELDPTLFEAASTLIWAAPLMETEVSELTAAASQLCLKYGEEYGIVCRANKLGTVNGQVMQKLGATAPSTVLMEKYLCNIATEFNVKYEPDEYMTEASPSSGNFGFDTFESGAGSLSNTSSCPYPTANNAFPNAEEILREIDGGSPRGAGIGSFSATSESPKRNTGQSDSLDVALQDSNYGFRKGLWNDGEDLTAEESARTS